MLNKERPECGIKAIRRSILKIMIDNSYRIIIWTVLIAWSTINIAYFIKVHRPVSIRSDGILCISIQCFIDSGISLFKSKNSVVYISIQSLEQTTQSCIPKPVTPQRQLASEVSRVHPLSP